jgi:hypothetical protein
VILKNISVFNFATISANHIFIIMKFRVEIIAGFDCSLERAFKTPMLCDVSKVHTGFGLMPRITHVTDDLNWGVPGSTKKVYAAKSLTQKGGYVSEDKIITRIENKYWKIEVCDFQSWMLGFYKFQGEWETLKISENRTLVTYVYTLYSKLPILYPLCWLFAHAFWKTYMKRVLENVRQLAYNQEPYRYQ